MDLERNSLQPEPSVNNLENSILDGRGFKARSNVTTHSKEKAQVLDCSLLRWGTEQP